MKSLLYLVILSVSYFCVNCKKDTDRPVQAKSLLKSLKELRFLPGDSMTISYNFDDDSVLVLEQNSKGLSIPGVRNRPDTPGMVAGWVKYRLYTYNSLNHLVSSVEYFSAMNGGKSVSRKDSSIYTGERLVGQELRSYKINYFGDYGFTYPLWLTKRYFVYNGRNQMISQNDSVFIMHDIPAGEMQIKQSQAKFIFTNQTTFAYNNAGEMTSKTALSNEDPGLTYSNGWSALDVSRPELVRSGTTRYTYEYNLTGQLKSKTSVFKEAGSGKDYASLFLYEYKP